MWPLRTGRVGSKESARKVTQKCALNLLFWSTQCINYLGIQIAIQIKGSKIIELL